MPDKAWKVFERRICELLGGKRSGPLGDSVCDCIGTPFSPEIKHGYGKFALRSDWIAQARKNQVPGKPWILVQAPKHSRTPLVTLEFDVFVELARDAGRIT